MRQLLSRFRREDEGVLTFEWILLITVLVIGIVGGVSAVRDGLIDELGDLVGAAVNLDQSYTVEVTDCGDGFGYENFGFQDEVPECNGNPVPQRQRPDPPAATQGAVGGCSQ